MNRIPPTLKTVVLAASPLLLAATPVRAADPAFATLEAASGEVVVLRQGQQVAVSGSLPLQLDDIVLTKRGRATVRFASDGSVLRVGPATRVQVDESAKERGITLFFGRVWAHVVRWRERPTRFESGSTIAAVRGTELSVAFESDGDRTQVAVLEGRVETRNDAGALELSGGQAATAQKGKAPVRAAQVRPKDAVQWALYFPPVLGAKPGGFGQGAPWQARSAASAEAWSRGDLAQAAASLEGVGDAEVKDPRFFTYRASVLLATGSVEDANRDLERALKLKDNDGDALALQAIVAVARNENDRALTLARRAADAAQKSAAPLIALSYAQQATFDLDGARASLEKAVTVDAQDAMAWARLAEIRSAQGLRVEALAAAEKAGSLGPKVARTQAVLGFAHLAAVETAAARDAFTKAATLDASDPLARLGLGLAKIRDGELDEGSRDLELAVSLDPAHSILRSYLGKAYYEQKREQLVGREYELARQNDPKDPTPWLYDAIFKQTTNRPVEALDSLQKAIERNDNRAVYRSRLLLDADLAARSASLGRLYADLGFQQLALVEGWTSVNTDPGNYSAHRLLADSYAARPRHEIARVSELFQSQMLQPLNTTPIQPTLGESNLLLLSSQGPANLSFNEFNPLFNRDQVTAQGGFLVGQGGTFAGEGIVSGISRKLSFSAGYAGFDTDGFRENDTQNDKIANAFVQAELGPNTSVQGEVRYRNLETGDLQLNFDESYSPFLSEKTEGTSARIGLRRDFGPSATFLASYMYADKDVDFAQPESLPGASFGLVSAEKSNSVEGQFQYRAPRVKVVAGGGYFDISGDETTVFEVSDPEFGFTLTDVTDRKNKHANLYAYSYIPITRYATLTLGASGDLYEETGTTLESFGLPGLPADPAAPVPALVFGEKNQFNPKAGLTVNLESGTTLRGAWFRTLKRTLITDQTLEPTQVAGFNQFFDDASATKSDVWGAALDQKIGAKVFAGAEYARRDLTIPQTLFDLESPEPSAIVQFTEGREDLARGYLFAAPHRWVSLGASLEYEKFERAAELALPFETLKTRRIPLSARFFHPSGFSAFATATYVKQEGDFLAFDETGANLYLPGAKDTWLVDAGLRYRLPRRFGFVVAGVNNLTDEQSVFQSTDPKNLVYRPGRMVYGRVVLAFP